MDSGILWLKEEYYGTVDGAALEYVEIPEDMRQHFRSPKYVNLRTETTKFDEGMLYSTTSGCSNTLMGNDKGVPSGSFLPELQYTKKAPTNKSVRIGGIRAGDQVFMLPRKIREWDAIHPITEEGVGFASIPNYVKFVESLLENPEWQIVSGFHSLWEEVKEISKMHTIPVTNSDAVEIDFDVALG